MVGPDLRAGRGPAKSDPTALRVRTIPEGFAFADLPNAFRMRKWPMTKKRFAGWRRLKIRAEDLEETFSRSSGPGGQNVNKVSTACVGQHTVPTGLTVTASDSRSQSTNRQLALMRLLEMFESSGPKSVEECLTGISKSRRRDAKRSRGTKRKLVEGKAQTQRKRKNCARRVSS